MEKNTMTNKSFTQQSTEADAVAFATDNLTHATAAASFSISRRSFIGKAGALTAAGVLAPALSPSAYADDGLEFADDDIKQSSGQDLTKKYHNDTFGTLHAKDLRKKAFKARLKAAEEEFNIDIPPLPNNGDEARYPEKISVATKGLKHDANGHVDPVSYESLLNALKSRRPEDFEKIILGGTAKLADPQGPLTTALEGINNSQLSIPLAATLDSAELAADHVELYWQALLRDVPFSEYRNGTSHPLVLAAVSELNSLPAFNGPTDNGRVTPETLFRSTAAYVDYQADPSGKKGKYVTPPGTLEGPYISQFLLRPLPAWGTIAGQPQLRPIQKEGETFGTDFDEWLAIRNGISTGKSITLESGRRHLINGRDLAILARNTGPTYLHVLQILLTAPVAGNPLAGGVGAPLNPANPYVNSKTQNSGSSFSSSFIQGLLALAGPLAIKTSYYQNWYVNRRLRPEDYAGLVHKVLANGANYPIHDDILNSDAAARVYSAFGSYLLPLANNTGAPTHPGYPSGATISAATPITLLKAFFDENYVIPNPVQVDPNDPTKLIPYTGAPLTLGGELNKLVNNIGYGRNFNGFHIRSDISASHTLGEALAISILRDQRYTYNENFAGYTFTKFDGTAVTV
jgi:hypothetical protein